MPDAQLLRLSGRMQWISEYDDPGETFEMSGTEMGRHPATHRLAADEESRRVTPLPGGGDHVRKCVLERGSLVGNLAALPHVREVKGHDIDAPSDKALRDSCHERMLLSCARAVCEHQHGIWLAVCSISNRTERRQVHANRR